MYKIECFSSILMGHTIPMAKMIDLLQSVKPQYDITLVTFKFAEELLSKQFPKVKGKYFYPQFTNDELEHFLQFQSDQIYNKINSSFSQYLADKTDLPDLIIADFFVYQAINFAKKNNVKLIINVPNSYESTLDLFNFLNLQRSTNSKGFLVCEPMPKLDFLFNFDMLADTFRGISRLMVSSFIGIDNPSLMPSNHTLIGILPNRARGKQCISEELIQWMDKWKKQGKQKFLYVSFGSRLRLSSKMAENLSKIFIALGYPTIWSLRAESTQSVNHPLIYYKSWLPESSILMLPEVKAYMTHCGWGSMTEAIQSQTPMICLPVFADQPANAKIASERKIGIQVYNKQHFLVPYYIQLELDYDHVSKSILEIIESSFYSDQIKKVKGISKFTNPTVILPKVIEETLLFGNSHLIVPRYEQVTHKIGIPRTEIFQEKLQ